MKSIDAQDVKKLFRWNLVMGLLHFAQGVLMLALSRESLTEIKLWLPQVNPVERSFGLEAEAWFSINLGYTISLFLFISAAAHLITISPKVFNWYLAKLSEKINLIRWYEYAISSSVMIFVIAVLCGMQDGLALLAIVGLNLTMNLFGAAMEMHNSSLKKISMLERLNVSKVAEINQDLDEDADFKPNWANFIYGCIAGILPWIIMAVYFLTSLDRLGAVEELPQQVKDVLNTVKLIFPILFVFFNLFAINMVLQYKRVWKWANYLFGEKIYILLSLLAKSFLAWFIWGGTLRP